MPSQMRAERCAISHAPELADEVALELVEIEARAERALAPADDHDANLADRHPPAHRLVELLEKLLADGVLLVRAVEPDAGDVALDLVLDRLDLDHATDMQALLIL